MKDIIIAFLTGGGFVAVISVVASVIESKRKKKDGITAALRELMSDAIERRCKDALERGYLSFAEYEDIQRKHSIYHDGLHGNGFLDDLMEKVSKLTITDGRTKL